MAKSQRASTRKRNNAKLRSTVFSPHYDARTERISAKLQEIAARPKPEREQEMEVDRGEEEAQATRSSDDMQIDDQAQVTKKGAGGLKKAGPTRIDKKKARRKSKHSIVFASTKNHNKGPPLRRKNR